MDLAEQLELKLNRVIKAASVDPETANLTELWQEIEPVLNQLPDADRMRLVGHAIAQLADLHERKANHLFADWEEKYNKTGPPVSDQLLDGLIQKTMHLDISDLIRKPPSRTKRKSSKSDQHGNSIVGVVGKEDLLKFLDTQNQDVVEEAITVAYEENVTDWADAITHWLNQQQAKQLPLTQIQQSLKMPLIQIWLVLLLDDYNLEQRGSFYDAEGIWVSKIPLQVW